MDFTFDLATNQLIPTNGVDEITLKWRSREPVRIHFHRDGTDELLPSGFGLALYLKRSTTMLATCTSFTAPGTAAGYYTGTLILNTDPLTTAFTTATVLSIAAKVEAHWWASGESASPSISDSVVSAQIVRPVVAPEPSSVETVTLGYEGTDIKSTGETGGAKYLREDGDGTCSWQSPSGSGDALVANNLDQFASVTQTAGQTLAITASTTLAGGTHSGTNTGDQSLAAYLTSATASSTYQPLDADLTSIAGLTKSGNTLKVIRVNAGETAYELATVTSGSGDAQTADPLSQFASTTSAQLAGVISDETGSGALVFANSPTLTTPTIGDGTEAAPSLSFTGDTNTGVYRPAADTVGIVGGGNDVVRMTGIASATDYLEIKNGIGVGSPLHVLAEGASANIGVHLQPKGSGLFTISDGTDFNKGIRFRSSSSAASAVTLIDAVSTAGRVITLPDATGTLALVSGDIGTPSSGNLASCTALPVSGITGSTSTALGVGSLEIGHASDTTLARLSAGNVGVEGNLLFRAGGSFVGLPVEIQLACSDETTACTTGTAKVTFRMPYAMTLTAVRASVTTAPTGSTFVIDINETATTILSTKLSIDASEKTSTTAATAAVISDSALADDAEITIDFDQIGSTIAGAGVKVTFIGTRA